MNIPILGFAGFSGSGKTTLIEKLIPLLRDMGLRVAVLKHDGHRFDIDRPGKDSARFSGAGAEIVVLTSREKTAVIDQRSLALEEALRFVRDVDLILVEGCKTADIPQIGIARQSTSEGFPSALNRYWRLVTDMELPEATVPVYHPDDVIPLAKDIAGHMEEFTAFCPCTPPSMDAWLTEAKAHPSAPKIGMYLTHNGIVRESAKAKVRHGAEGTKPVTGMVFSYDREKVDAVIADTYKMQGIYYIKVWLNEGLLKVGDDIMYVLIGGDIRPRVVDALQYLVGRIKNECVTETELT